MKSRLILFSIGLFLSLALTLHATHANEHTNAEQQFAQRMAKQYGFKAKDIENILANAQKRQDIIDKISRPAERRLNWGQYRKIFLTEKRIRAGVKFWHENAQALARAEQTYGVPAQFIVAIIGVETFYGRITGNDSVLDALYTLAFHYPKRSRFFTSELEHYLLLTREERLDPTQPKGSYAGAMGLGQFMPSSYRRYAVDFDNDGKRDIWNNPTDAIGSVANYFHQHGWKTGLPVAARVQGFDDKAHRHFLKLGLKPRTSVGELRKAGLKLPETLADDLKTALIELETRKGKEYWAALHNFYVITRYNHSELYAMAVFQLSEAIKKDYAE